MQVRGLDIAVAVAAIASCALIAWDGAQGSSWSWSKFGYDLGMGMLISIVFYIMLVRIPEVRKSAKLKRNILNRYTTMKRECIIQLLFASGSRSVETRFWDGLLDPPAFRDYFYRDKRRRWYLAMNNVNTGYEECFQGIIKAVELFRDELRSVDIHLIARWIARRKMKAAKLSSVFSYRVAMLRNCLRSQKKFSTRCRQRYMAKSQGMTSLRSAFGGMTAWVSAWRSNSRRRLLSNPLSASSASMSMPSIRSGAAMLS